MPKSIRPPPQWLPQTWAAGAVCDCVRGFFSHMGRSGAGFDGRCAPSSMRSGKRLLVRRCCGSLTRRQVHAPAPLGIWAEHGTQTGPRRRQSRPCKTRQDVPCAGGACPPTDSMRFSKWGKAWEALSRRFGNHACPRSNLAWVSCSLNILAHNCCGMENLRQRLLSP